MIHFPSDSKTAPRFSRISLISFLFLGFFFGGIYSKNLRADGTTTTLQALPHKIKAKVLKTMNLKEVGDSNQIEKPLNEVAETVGEIQAKTYIEELKKSDPTANPVFRAIDENRVDVITYLPASVPREKLSEKDGEGNTPLHKAAGKGNEKMVRALTKHLSRSQMNEKNADGNTPLHNAVLSRNEKTVEALTKHLSREQMNEKDKYGNTPLHRAADIGNKNMVKELTKYLSPLQINEKNGAGSTPLYRAAENGHEEVVGELTKHLPDAPATSDGDTILLHKAAPSENEKTVEPVTRNNVPPSKATEKGHEKVIEPSGNSGRGLL
ncbi:MAG: ankyrin repeat domain-containing protein [Bdellovibrionia bacterium]